MSDFQQIYTNIPLVYLEGSETSNESVSIVEPAPQNFNKYMSKTVSKQNNSDLCVKYDEISVPVTGIDNEFRTIPLTQIGTLHYKALQAVAFNMNLPANVKRKELMALIVARKTGKEHIVNRILAEVVKDRAFRREQSKKHQTKKPKIKTSTLTNVANRYAVNSTQHQGSSDMSSYLDNVNSHFPKVAKKRPAATATVTSAPDDSEIDKELGKRLKLDGKSELVVEILDDDLKPTNVGNECTHRDSANSWCLNYLDRDVTYGTNTCTETRFIVKMVPDTCVIPWYHAPVMTPTVQQTAYNLGNVQKANDDEEEQIPEDLRNIYYDLLQNNDINYDKFKDALGNRDMNKILDFIMCTETQLEDYNRQLNSQEGNEESQSLTSSAQSVQTEEIETESTGSSVTIEISDNVTHDGKYDRTVKGVYVTLMLNNAYSASLTNIDAISRWIDTIACINCQTEVVYCVPHISIPATFEYVPVQGYAVRTETTDINDQSVDYVLRQIPSQIYDNLTKDLSTGNPQDNVSPSEFIDYNDLCVNSACVSDQTYSPKQIGSYQCVQNISSTYQNCFAENTLVDTNDNHVHNSSDMLCTRNPVMMQYVEQMIKRDATMIPDAAEPTIQSGSSSIDLYDSPSTSRGAQHSKNHDYTELQLKEREPLSDYVDLDQINVTYKFISRYEDIRPYTEDFSDVTFSNVNRYEETMVAHHKNKCEHQQIQCPFLYTLCYWFEYVPLMPLHIRKMHPEKIVRKDRAQYDINCIHLQTLRHTGVKIIQEVKNHMYFISLCYNRPLVFITIQEVCETELQHADRTMARLTVRHHLRLENWTGKTNAMDIPLSHLWNPQTSLVLSPYFLHQFPDKHFKLLVEIGI